jgi:hypothetical protein
MLRKRSFCCGNTEVIKTEINNIADITVGQIKILENGSESRLEFPFPADNTIKLLILGGFLQTVNKKIAVIPHES